MTKIKLWHTKTREQILSTPVFNIHKKKSISPLTNGVGDFFTIEYPRPWVNVIAETPKNEIVMIRQYRHGTENIELEIPGGLVEKGEDPLNAGIRELCEETGYTGLDAKIIGKVIPNPALQNNWCYTVLVKNAKLTYSLNLDENEDIESSLLPVNEILEKIKNGTISHGLVLNALFFYFLDIKKQL